MQPSDLYNIKCAEDWDDNPAHRVILSTLDALCQKQNRRVTFKHATSGLYLYGDVGTGKSSLLSLFYTCLKERRKQRLHFHAFIHNIQLTLQNYQGHSNPVDHLIKQFSKTTRVLFLDEFLVHDIAHASLLKNILSACIKYRIFIITTANESPANSYKHGINQYLFDPAITLIYTRFMVLEMNSDIDYRELHNNLNRRYFHPITDATIAFLTRIFQQISTCKVMPIALEVNEHSTQALAYSNQVLWMDFDTLISPPRCKTDYLTLFKTIHTLIISGAHTLYRHEKDKTCNVCHLVDILYEQDITLFIAAKCKFTELFDRENQYPGIKRTISRLQFLTQHNKTA